VRKIFLIPLVLSFGCQNSNTNSGANINTSELLGPRLEVYPSANFYSGWENQNLLELGEPFPSTSFNYDDFLNHFLSPSDCQNEEQKTSHLHLKTPEIQILI
jgi:hypothetical protein